MSYHKMTKAKLIEIVEKQDSKLEAGYKAREQIIRERDDARALLAKAEGCYQKANRENDKWRSVAQSRKEVIGNRESEIVEIQERNAELAKLAESNQKLARRLEKELGESREAFQQVSARAREEGGKRKDAAFKIGELQGRIGREQALRESAETHVQEMIETIDSLERDVERQKKLADELGKITDKQAEEIRAHRQVKKNIGEVISTKDSLIAEQQKKLDELNRQANKSTQEIINHIAELSRRAERIHVLEDESKRYESQADASAKRTVEAQAELQAARESFTGEIHRLSDLVHAWQTAYAKEQQARAEGWKDLCYLTRHYGDLHGIVSSNPMADSLVADILEKLGTLNPSLAPIALSPELEHTVMNTVEGPC